MAKYAVSFITESTMLGNMPDPGKIAGLKLPTFSNSEPNPSSKTATQGTPGTKVTADSGKAGNSDATPSTLGEGLPPVPAKLVGKIRRGEYVDMAELLRDNMELQRRRDIRETTTNTFGVTSHPNRREVPDLLSWVQCFGMYAAILCDSYPEKVQQLYAYQTMIVREARGCGRKGWLSYDQMFRQQAAISATDWSKLNNSLYATTFLQQ